MDIRWGVFVGAIGTTMVLSAAAAEAKCGFRRYRVAVEFRSDVTRAPLTGVQLAVFANGFDREMPPDKSAPHDIASRADGGLVRAYLFNTYSGRGFFVADRCNDKVRTLELVAMHPDYRAKRISLKNLQITPKDADDLETIVIPLVLMDPS